MAEARAFQVSITPPELDDGAPAAEFAEVARHATRPPMEDLAARAWLTQGDSVRGAWISTHGLFALHGHPELEMVNVPVAFIGAAGDLMNQLGDYICSGARLAAGETMAMPGPFGNALVGVLEAPDDDPDRVPMLRVVMLV